MLTANREETSTRRTFRKNGTAHTHFPAHFCTGVNWSDKRVLANAFDSKTDSKTVRKREKMGDFWRT